MDFKPYAIRPDEELPFATIPDVPHISENYAFYAYDFVKRTGFVAYVGRWVKNPRVWREQLFIYLPDGSVLAHIGIGQAPDAQTPSGGATRFRYDAERKRWHIGFEGAMRHSTYDEYSQEPIPPGRPQPVRFEATFDSELPILMMPPANNTTFGNSHYEQMGTGTGWFDFGGRRHEFSGPGYRDHSRGPRQFGALDAHVWLQLFFPHGPRFSAYHVWAVQDGKPVQILDKALSIRPDGFGPASFGTPVRLHTLDTVLDPIELEVTVEGRAYRLRGKPLTPPLLATFNSEVDFYFGCAPSLGEFVGTEYPLLFEYDGGTVPGYMQRSLRLPHHR